MGTPKEELYLLTKRDEAEKERFAFSIDPLSYILILYRLNQQNITSNAVRGGHILDPAIPKQHISRIADIATGTGCVIHVSRNVTSLTAPPGSGWMMLGQNSQQLAIHVLLTWSDSTSLPLSSPRAPSQEPDSWCGI